MHSPSVRNRDDPTIPRAHELRVVSHWLNFGAQLGSGAVSSSHFVPSAP
jgi:hypothetical protein